MSIAKSKRGFLRLLGAMILPENAVAGSIEVVREQGTNVRRKVTEFIDNSFAENLEKSGLLKEIWGGEMPK